MGDDRPFTTRRVAPALTQPRYVVLGTPNTSGPMGTVYGGIFHGTRSGRPEFSKSRGDGSEGRRTITYCRTPGTTSYGWIIDYDGTINELAGWHQQAWHAGHRIDPAAHGHSRDTCMALHMNANWYGIAFAQVDTWEPITPEQHAAARWLVREIQRRAGVPLTQFTHVAGRFAARGFTEHRWTAQGQFHGKTDVGDLFRWDLVLL